MSRQRKFRLARTGVILFVLIVIIARCAGDDDPGETVATNTSTTTSTTSRPATATTVTAEVSAAKLPLPHYGTGAASTGGKIVMPGGLDAKRSSTPVVWRFDPADGTTANIGRLPTATRDGAVSAIGDVAWMLGGGARGTAALSSTISVDDVGTVTNAGKLPGARVDAVAVSSDDGASIYVVGGFDGKNQTTGTNEVLKTTDGVTFTTIATLQQSVRKPAVALLGRSIYVMGGSWGANQAPLTTIQRVDVDSGNAIVVNQLPQAISSAAAFVLGGSIFVAGGRTAEDSTDQILRIDPVTATATKAGTLPTKIRDAMVGVVGETGYLLGGLTPNPSDGIITLTAS